VTSFCRTPHEKVRSRPGNLAPHRARALLHQRAMPWMKAMAIALLVLASVPARSDAADCSAGPDDVDADGVCDAHDPCAGLNSGVRLREVSLQLRKLGGRPADDTLRLRAIVPLGNGAGLDPAATGLRLTVLDNAWTSDDLVLDVAAPGGAGWTANAGGRSWTYRATDSATDGIKRALVKEIDPNPAYASTRALRVSVDARRGTYDETSDLQSHLVSLAFAGTGIADVCAERGFYPWLFTGLPGDMMICDAQNAANAQELYRAQTGAYYTGSCADLPGFAASPNVTCTTSGSDAGFMVSTSHVDPSQWSACEWNSQSTPTLSCF
jgi:hypothetical protein